MAKKKKESKSSHDRRMIQIDELSRNVERALKETGLFDRVRVNQGDLRAEDRNPYIEFKFKEDDGLDILDRYESDGCELRSRIVDKIHRNWSEVDCIETVLIARGVYREVLRLHDFAQLDNLEASKLIKGVLGIVVDETKNYNQYS